MPAPQPQHHPRPGPTSRRSGFTLLELILAVVITAMVCSIVVRILSRIEQDSTTIRRRLDLQNAVQHSLDRLMNDITYSFDEGATVQVEQTEYGWQTLSHLTVLSSGSEEGEAATNSIEWLSVPRYEEEDLILLRRERRSSNEDQAAYVPMCENLFSFEVDLMEPNTQLIDAEPNEIVIPSFLEVRATLYRDQGLARSSDRVVTFSRTVCLNRFELSQEAIE